MLTWDEALLLAVFISWAIWFSRAANTAWVPIPPIARHTYPSHPTRGTYKSKQISDRVYIVAGGSGFVGSWIVRYLLARGDARIFILDRFRPPPDICKPEVTFVQLDLSAGVYVDLELSRVRETVLDSTAVIVYNCCLVRRFDLANFRADLGVAVAEFLYVGLRLFEHKRVFVVHVGDTLAHRAPIRNWDRVWPTRELWCQTAAPDVPDVPDVLPEVGQQDQSTHFDQSTQPGPAWPHGGPHPDSAEDAQERSFSAYAWHQKEVEDITLRLSDHPAVAASAVLRIEGYVSGHLGDGLLSPSIQAGYMVMHSPNAPLTLVHVEDIARGCLNLEYALTDPKTRAAYSGQRFTVGSQEVTSLQRIAEYIQEARPSFTVYRIPAVLMFIATWLLCFMYTPRPSPRKRPRDSLLRISPGVLTFARLYTLQVGQLPNPENARRQHELLHLRNNFSLSQILDGVLSEVAYVERQA